MVNKKKQENAFTLLELSIVLVVISLIVTSVAGGMTLVKNAEIRAISAEFENHRVSFENFVNAYNALPGDISDTRIVGSTGALRDNAFAGDGDGLIEITCVANRNESLQAWRHLSLAGMTDGNYTGDGVGAGCIAQRGTNIPRSRIDGAGFSFESFEVIFGTDFNLRKNTLIFGGEVSGTMFSDSASISPSNALKFDLKYDDGLPLSGNFWASNGAQNPGINECVNITNNPNDNVYILAADGTSDLQRCIIAYILD